MNSSLRAPDPDESPSPSARPADHVSLSELRVRALEQVEAEAAVAAVMRREVTKAERLAAAEGRSRRKPKRARVALLAALLLFNGYLWVGNPEWLAWHEPPAPSIDYYQNSYKISVYLQRQRIEEYRKSKQELPAVARQAGPAVRGVQYTPLSKDRYELVAGRGPLAVVYSSSDSIAVFMGRALMQMGLYASGVR